MSAPLSDCAYAELHCLSNFSFLRGASHPEELVLRAHELGYGALAITDECSLAGVVRAHLEARRCGLPLLVGSELALGDPFAQARLVLLAQTRQGYGNLSELVSMARGRAAKGQYRIVAADLDDAVPDCLAVWVPWPGACDRALDAQASWLRERFDGRAWIAVELLRRGGDAGWLARLQAASARSGVPLVAAGDVQMHRRSRKSLHDTLAAIRLGVPVAHLGEALASNAEQHLRTRAALARLYPAELLQRTIEIAAHCTFSLDELRYEYPEEIVPAGHTPASWLRVRVDEGIVRRWPAGADAQVRAGIERELALIAELRYEPYFLTVADIVAFAREQGILCQGRGSAANSVVCYCLGITEVSPARAQLLFERFVNRERAEPPDIDVDFEHRRREEVIQYVYRRYGRHRAALAATVVRYRARSAMRDVGRALELDARGLERLAGLHQWWDGRAIRAERLAEAGFDARAPIVQHWLRLTATLCDFPRHLSQHVGGFVIARDRLTRLVPVENAAMPGRTVIQWDKDDLDALGLLKVDLLALGMLSALRRALDLAGRRRGLRDARGRVAPLRIQDIAEDDADTYDMICRADTVGVFQIESRAQMTMLPRLRPRCYYDLVVEVAIVRPGPLQGGVVHPYLRRRLGLEPERYPSEALRPALARTRGVPVFQEQIMQVAMIAAGFSAGEADRLRRAMTARRAGELDRFGPRLLDGMRARGYPDEFAQAVFRQIQGFGEYGFPESHAASFALLVYASAWLKRHEPAAFLAGLLDSQPMGFYAPAQLVRDARAHGVRVLAVDVAASQRLCTLEGDLAPVALPVPDGTPDAWGRHQPAVRLGLNRVRGLSTAAADRIVTARAQAPFADVADLARRTQVSSRDLDALAAAGALATLAGHRRLARWAVAGIDAAAPHEAPLLVRAAPAEPLPALASPTEAREIVADYASLGLTLGRHPLALLRPRLDRLRAEPASVLAGLPHGRIVRASGLVTHRQRPGTAHGTLFVTLEDETGTLNVIVWPRLVERFRTAVLSARLMTVQGVWQRDADSGGRVAHLVARSVADHSALLGDLMTGSRDFR